MAEAEQFRVALVAEHQLVGGVTVGGDRRRSPVVEIGLVPPSIPSARFAGIGTGSP